MNLTLCFARREVKITLDVEASSMKLPPGHIPGAGIKQATAYGGLGEKLLKQYGWKEGQGLGVQGTGIKTAIKVLKKDDTIGVSKAWFLYLVLMANP